MIRKVRQMLGFLTSRLGRTSTGMQPPIPLTSDLEKQRIAEQRARERRELAHLQVRAMTLAIEARGQRQVNPETQGEHGH